MAHGRRQGTLMHVATRLPLSGAAARGGADAGTLPASQTGHPAQRGPRCQTLHSTRCGGRGEAAGRGRLYRSSMCFQVGLSMLGQQQGAGTPAGAPRLVGPRRWRPALSCLQRAAGQEGSGHAREVPPHLPRCRARCDGSPASEWSPARGCTEPPAPAPAAPALPAGPAAPPQPPQRRSSPQSRLARRPGQPRWLPLWACRPPCRPGRARLCSRCTWCSI